MKKMMKMGSKGNQFHDKKPQPCSANMPLFCPKTMSDMFKLPDTISTTTKQKPIAIS